jgi:aldose 1-epimerase
MIGESSGRRREMIVAILCMAFLQEGKATMAEWGKADGKAVQLVTLSNSKGMTVKATSLGTIITEVHVPDRSGKMGDVVLGCPTLEAYLSGHPAFGCTVGRYANRIAGAKFTLDGKEYALAANNGPNHIHGGKKGFHAHVWDAEPGPGASVKFTRTSPDGEEGYPGTLQASVVYTVTEANELRIEMTATTDRPTVVNLANHTYWNLGGHDSGPVLEQTMQLFADSYTPADAALIPTGEIAPVAGTAYDFREAKPIGRDLAKTPEGRGYDTNFVVRGKPGELRPAARAEDPKSGRVMELLTTDAGVQLYTANFLANYGKGKGGATYHRHGGFCLETQKYPDSIHKPDWPQPVLRPGETYRHVMVHRFSVK